jgi:hypothetical protein
MNVQTARLAIVALGTATIQPRVMPTGAAWGQLDNASALRGMLVRRARLVVQSGSERIAKTFATQI